MDSPSNVAIVADLGFGDAGKGTTVDFLVRRLGARTVCRFNGGAQAGHNVVLDDGRHHCFAQFGAGSFVPGVGTHLSRFMVVHPTGLLAEARILAGKGLADPLAGLTIDRRALVITPYQQAATRLRELLRGDARHGSCGVGVGETVKDSLEHADDSVRAGDLGDRRTLRRKLAAIRERKAAELLGPARDAFSSAGPGSDLARREMAVLEGADEEAWVAASGEVSARVVPEDALRRLLFEGPVVFEGAHGVLLDEWRGFHPYTTWATCTFENALALLDEARWDGPTLRLGVLRAYATRHGPGPFPTEAPELSHGLPEPHNPTGTWQGGFRVGWFDSLLARYAIEAAGGVDGLVLTHLDDVARSGWRWRACRAYRFAGPPDPACFTVGAWRSKATACFGEAGGDADATAVRLGPPRDLAHQERLGKLLARAIPCLDPNDLAFRGPDDFVSHVEESLGAPLALTSAGPTASGKSVRRLPGLLS